MKTLLLLKFMLCLALLSGNFAQAELYFDGGVSYQRFNIGGQTEQVSLTDVMVAYTGRIDLPFRRTNEDTYRIAAKYRQADYRINTQNDYDQWQLMASLRKYLRKNWSMVFSTDYLSVNAELPQLELDGITLGVRNEYRPIEPLLLTQGLRYRNLFYANDDNQSSVGYTLGSQLDFNDFFSAYAEYSVDQDYLDNLNIIERDTSIKTAQIGILLSTDESNWLRLGYQRIDYNNVTENIFVSDFVLRY